MSNNLFSALIFGLIGGAIPGPILASIFTEVLQFGFSKCIRIILIALITESAVALACLMLLSSLNISESIFSLISLVGAGILIWLATSIWKIKTIDTKQRVHFSTGKIIAMILANGALWTFWLTVVIPKAISFQSSIKYGEFFYMFFVEIGWLISTTLIAFIFSRFRKLLQNPKVIPYLFKFFALVFVYFALDMIYKSVNYFFNK